MIYKRTQTENYKFIALLAVIIYCVSIFFFSLINANYVWDILGYAASVYDISGLEPSEIHKIVYSELKMNSSTANYNELTNGTLYRQIMSSDAEAFYQQIPFYKIRIIYVLILYVLLKLGFGIFEIAHILQAGFGIAGILLIYLYLKDYIQHLLWPFILLAFFGVTTEFTLLQQGGVDMLAFFWMSMSIIFYVRNSRLLLPSLGLSVLIRTDLIIHAGLLLLLLFITDKTIRRTVLYWGAVMLALYFAVNTWAGNYGWFSLIHFVFVSEMSATHPEVYSESISFGFNDYMEFIFSSYSWISPWLWACMSSAIVSLVLFYSYYWKSNEKINSNNSEHFAVVTKLNSIAILCLAYVGLHYVLFPAIFMRFFIGSCLFMVISLLSTISFLQPLMFTNTIANQKHN